jgi:hypothetical protein
VSVTVTRRRLAVLVGFAALEISVVVYFRNQFLWVALVTYVTLDRYLAGCALTGCPRVPFP